MIRNRIVSQAVKTLTDTEKEMLSLLTDEKTEREDVIAFLCRYRIDDEPSATTYFINDLLDKFGIEEQTSDIIPRVRGLRSYFQFANAKGMMELPAQEWITDIDYYLKLRFPDDVRPFTSGSVLTQKRLSGLLGKKRTDRIRSEAVTVFLHNKEYRIPDDKYLVDLLYCGIYLSLRENGWCSLGCLYDVYRYGKSKNPGAYTAVALYICNIRHKTGRFVRKLWKSKR